MYVYIEEHTSACSTYSTYSTYWVLVVTRPARHELVPQAVCQWGKLVRIMIMLSFIDVWHEATLKQIAWAHSLQIDVADDARATPAPATHKAKGLVCHGGSEGALLNVEAHSRPKTQWRTASGQDTEKVKPANTWEFDFLCRSVG